MSDALPQILTADQLAAELGLFDENGRPHRRQIYRFVEAGLPHRRMGRSIWFVRDRVREFFNDDTNLTGAVSDFPQERRSARG